MNTEVHELKRIADILEKLYKLAIKEEHEDCPHELNVNWFVIDKGDLIMSTNAVALNLDSTAKAVGVVTELNNDGSVFTFTPSSIQVAVQDTTIIAALVDPATGNPTVTPLKVGSTQVMVQDSVTGISSPAYTFTVSQVTTGPTPASLSVSWTVTP